MAHESGITIFLAEDDRDDRFLFQEALNKTGHAAETRFAENGEILIEMLQQENKSPDFIFLDLNMPKKDGYFCLHEIRANEKLNDVPVIILSTSSNEQSVDKAYDGGADLYVQKPDNFSGLIKVLDICLKRFAQIKGKPSKENFLLMV